MSMSSEAGDAKAPLTILLTGGIASGKSTVAALFAKRGAVVLDADKLAHEALESPDVIAEVTKTFGESIIDSGRIDRKKLGAVVFRDTARLSRLEAIIHPRVIAKVTAQLKDLSGARRKAVVLDVPLATEAGVGADIVVFVDSSHEARTRRARELRGWSEGELEKRESRQVSVEEKRRKADAVVKNEGGVEETERDVERIWTSLVGPRLEG
jgi:dephospho-CoA kinase